MPQGEDALSYWKSHIPIAAIIDGKKDLRSVTGLTKAVQRRLQSKTVEATLLNNYSKLVKGCMQLSPTLLKTVSDSDLAKQLEILESEDIPLTPTLQFNLLMRRVNTAVTEHRFHEVVAMLNPWREESFSWRSPTLAGLSAEPNKFATFRNTIFNDVLCKQLLEGEAKSVLVKQICLQCIEMAGMVDLVSMETQAAKMLSECD
eukprot:6377465-Amphidinium_carterae.1